MILLGEAAGRWLEPAGDRRRRGMIATALAGAPNRIRLTGGLCPSSVADRPKSLKDHACHGARPALIPHNTTRWTRRSTTFPAVPRWKHGYVHIGRTGRATLYDKRVRHLTFHLQIMR